MLCDISPIEIPNRFCVGADRFTKCANPFVKVQTEIKFDCTTFELNLFYASSKAGTIISIIYFIQVECTLVPFSMWLHLHIAVLKQFRKHILIVHKCSFTLCSNLENCKRYRSRNVRTNNLVQYSVTLLHIFTKATWCF